MSEILTQSGAVLQSDFLDSFFKGRVDSCYCTGIRKQRSVDAGVYESRNRCKRRWKRVIPGFIVVPVKSFGIKVLHRDICKK